MPLASTSRITPTVFVVDDDESVRESLELLIAYAGWHAELFSSARAFLAHPRALAPSCLVLDVALPDVNGLDLQKRIAVESVEMPIILITGYANVPMAVEAMKAGAFEFLTKPFDNDVLLNAVERAIERSQAALSREAEIRTVREHHALLTDRERDVMALVVAGRPNKTIGLELGISEITVKTHRGKVMRKMQADSLADLVNIAARISASSQRAPTSTGADRYRSGNSRFRSSILGRSLMTM
jgi:FixJ family two-component response regulator